jgi:MFS family permease
MEPAAGLLRDRRFLAFTSANFVNNVGNGIYAVALPLLAYDLTASLRVMSLLSAVVPVVMLLGPVTGMLVDRYGSRVAVVPGLVLQAVAGLLVNVLVTRGEAPVAVLFVLALLIQIGSSVYLLGWQVSLPGLFPRNPLKARGWLNTTFFVSLAVGPVIVSVGLRWTGYVGLLWINLATFAAPILVWFAGIRPPPAGPTAPEPADAGRRWWQEILEGARVVGQDSRLRAVTVVRALLAVAFGPGAIPLVLYRLRSSWDLSGSAVGQVMAVYAAATILGNLYVVGRGEFRPRGYLLAGVVLHVVAALALGTGRLSVFVAGMGLLGLATGLVTSTYVLMPIRYLKPGILGRGSAFINLVLGVVCLGSPVITTFLAAQVGPGPTFLILTVGPVAAFAYLAFAPWVTVPDRIDAVEQTVHQGGRA